MVSSLAAGSSTAQRIGISKLTRMAFEGNRMDRLSSQLLIESMKSSQNAGILMDLATVEQLRGNTRAGLEFQNAALKQARAFTSHSETDPVLTLLVLSAPIEIGGNTPVEFLLENSNIKMINFYVDPDGDRVNDFPDHDQIFVAAPGDDSINNPFIQHIGQIVTENGLQVFNSPDQIMKLDRDLLPELLCDIPKTSVPPIMRVSRTDLEGEFSNCKELSQFEKLSSEPFVIRPTASHAGKGLELLQNRVELTTYTAKHVSDEYFISRFVDYRSGDGNFRKYRIIFINGRVYPYHLAIGDSWKLWYMNAHMGACRKKIAEEADFLKSFDQYFAVQHADALNCIAERVGLEYFGIDCAVTKTGDLLVFEADNALIVHDMDAVDEFSYKQEAMATLFTAFEAMILGGSSKTSNTGHPGHDNLINTRPHSIS